MKKRRWVEFFHNVGVHRFCIRTYVTGPNMWVPEGVDIDLTFGPTQEVHS